MSNKCPLSAGRSSLAKGKLIERNEKERANLPTDCRAVFAVDKSLRMPEPLNYFGPPLKNRRLKAKIWTKTESRAATREHFTYADTREGVQTFCQKVCEETEETFCVLATLD